MSYKKIQPQSDAISDPRGQLLHTSLTPSLVWFSVLPKDTSAGFMFADKSFLTLIHKEQSTQNLNGRRSASSERADVLTSVHLGSKWRSHHEEWTSQLVVNKLQHEVCIQQHAGKYIRAADIMQLVNYRVTNRVIMCGMY